MQPSCNAKRSRSWIFTWNNPIGFIEEVQSMATEQGAKTFTGQLEKGENETPHFQFFLQFDHPRAWTTLKKVFPKCHIEAAKCPFQAYQYCQKAETRVDGPVSFGPIPKPLKSQGADYSEFNKLVLELGPEQLVRSGQLSIKDYAKTKQSIALFLLHDSKPVSVDALEHTWCYGSPGVGKSRQIREKYPDIFIKSINKWWDGYQGEEDVLLDDFGPEHKVLAYYIKIWADHYPFKAEIKGGSISIRPKRVHITSNYSPE